MDGDKFVCLDLILKKDSCIIYSFGVGNDWTFEDQMDNIGFVIILLLECFFLSKFLLKSRNIK